MWSNQRKIYRTAKIKPLVNPLSQELLAGNFGDGDTIKVDVSGRVGLVFTKQILLACAK
jgi:hypothetical protein